MVIEIVVSRNGLRRFHRLLKDRVARAFPGAGVTLRASANSLALPASVPLLLSLERLIFRRGRETICDPLPEEQFGAPTSADADVVIDFSGDLSGPKPGVLILRPLFDGEGAEAALIGALVSGRAPRIAIENRNTGEIVGVGVPSLEAADGLIGGMEAVYSRMTTLIEQAICEPFRASPRPKFAVESASDASVARYAVRGWAVSAARMLYHLVCHAPHWRVGWRYNDGAGVIDIGRLDGPKWNVLADPGRRFFADPFPIVWRGRTCLFFEDFDHRIGKGVISVVEFGPGGPIGEITPVIEEPWHLSYPFLIEADGELWMAPESSASGQTPLYRCVEFPWRWERREPLIEGIEAADATIFRHNGLYYMTSVVREGLGGYSDTLAIHYAPSLFGPWRAHGAPVLIDAAAARPAGAVVSRQGNLWRPVQDCSRGYGLALRLARIDHLDPERFEQTFVSEIRSGPLWPGGRIHTLNRAGRLECIDGVSVTPKLTMLRRLAEHRAEPADPVARAGGESTAPRGKLERSGGRLVS